MATIYDYLKWRGELSFREAPINEVDCLLFSVLSYLDFDGIVPSEHTGASVPIKAAANTFFSKYPEPEQLKIGVLLPKDIIVLLRRIKDLRRFRNVEMRAYVNRVDPKEQIQFSAVTFLPGDGSAVVTYRGTDDSLIGWKENFNMSFLPVVPAQLAALEYLEKAAEVHPGALYLAGHSKGGNLAVYSAVHACPATRERLVQVYNYDGPGFYSPQLTDPAYLEVRPLIRTLVPQSSVVGMLLEHDDNYTVIKSRQTGLLQHNGLSWEVLGSSFIRLRSISSGSRNTDRTLNQWIRAMTPEQREEFTDAIYELLSVNNAMTLTELLSARAHWSEHSKKVDPQVHKTIQRMLSMLISMNTKNFVSGLFRRQKTEDETAGKLSD